MASLGAVAVLAAVVTLTVLITDNSATITEPAYPSHQLDDPIAPWIFVYGWPTIWFGVLVLITVQFARSRVLSMPAILFLAGTTMFWIEWPADWGSYLVYNRDFWTFRGWTSTWYQTYWKPVGVIFGYGVFFGAEALILLHVVPRVKAGTAAASRRTPRPPPYWWRRAWADVLCRRHPGEP